MVGLYQSQAASDAKLFTGFRKVPTSLSPGFVNNLVNFLTTGIDHKFQLVSIFKSPENYRRDLTICSDGCQLQVTGIWLRIPLSARSRGVSRHNVHSVASFWISNITLPREACSTLQLSANIVILNFDRI